jgi:hypothetical protein
MVKKETIEIAECYSRRDYVVSTQLAFVFIFVLRLIRRKRKNTSNCSTIKPVREKNRTVTTDRKTNGMSSPVDMHNLCQKG